MIDLFPLKGEVENLVNKARTCRFNMFQWHYSAIHDERGAGKTTQITMSIISIKTPL